MIRKKIPTLRIEFLKAATNETIVAELYKRLRNCGHNCSINFPVVTEYDEEIILDLVVFYKGEIAVIVLFNASNDKFEKIVSIAEDVPVIQYNLGYKDLMLPMQNIFDHFKNYGVYIGKNRFE